MNRGIRGDKKVNAKCHWKGVNVRSSHFTLQTLKTSQKRETLGATERGDKTRG